MKKERTYLSSDHQTEIHAIEWIPEKEPVAILQIAHGMTEFIQRYQRFAQFLNQQGFIVVGNDHLGHGQSITDREQLGYFGQPDGNEYVIQDMHTLYSLTKIQYPHLPYFLLGHSMGSFLARQFIERYGDVLDGAIIMGTGEMSAMIIEAAKQLANFIIHTKGSHYCSQFLTKLVLGSNNNAFKPARTRYDWLTKDTEIVDTYSANPDNTFTFTANAYYHMFKGIQYAQQHVSDIPKDLPILIVSGADDPVGDFGLGPKKLYDTYLEHDIQDVTLRLYENDRHEILNETNYRQVYQDLYSWLSTHITK